jgi:beta-glucosidase
MTPDGKITLSFTVANTGRVAGAEVVQFYLRDPVASVVRPVQELKGFQRVLLQPGQRRTVSFTVDRETLSFFDRHLKWGAEPGRFDLMVGSASDDIRLRRSIELVPR